jgi:hypothetical protein
MRVEGGIVTRAQRGNYELRMVRSLSIPRGVVIIIAVVFLENITPKVKELAVYVFHFLCFFRWFYDFISLAFILQT